MSIDIKCPQCGNELEAADEAAGKRVKCPNCGAVLVADPLVSEDRAADILLEDDPTRAIAEAPAGGAVSRRPPREGASRTSPRQTRVTASSLRMPGNAPARVAGTFALLSLVPGLALVIGPFAVLLGVLALLVGWVRRRAGATRAGAPALGLGLLTSAGNWALLLYVISILGLPAPLARAFAKRAAPRAADHVHADPLDDPRFGFDPDPVERFPPRADPFAEEEKPNPARRKSLKVANDMGFPSVVFSADGKRAVVLQARNAELWELETGKHHAIVGGGEGFAFSPNGKWLAVVRDSRTELEVRLYDLDKDEYRKTLPVGGIAFPKARLAFSADGSLLAVASANGVRLWRTADWQELPARLRAEFFRSEALALSPDGSVLAVGVDFPFDGGERGGLLWDTQQGKEKARLPGNKIRVEGLAFAPDGKTLVVSGWNEVTLYDVAKRTEVWTIERDPFHALVVFSADGQMIASGGPTGTLILSNAATGKTLARLNSGSHHSGFTAAQFTPDGSALLTSSVEGVIETWDVAELRKQGPQK